MADDIKRYRDSLRHGLNGIAPLCVGRDNSENQDSDRPTDQRRILFTRN
jgi:hypothetical protein